MNNLLPKNFDILPQDDKLSQKPVLLEAWENGELWFKKDDEFKRPKGIVTLTIYNDNKSSKDQVRDKVFKDMWDACFGEFRREFSFKAKLASLNFSHSMEVG